MSRKIKRILHGEQARAKAKEGIDLVADTIKTTLGPKGRNVLFKDLGPLPPRIINDGHQLASKIKHEDCFINAGVEMIQEICKKTNDNAGDGTTTTALLAQKIVEEGQKALLAGENAMDLKKEIEDDKDLVLGELKKISKPIELTEQLKHIATISANNDIEAGEAIAEIVDKVGKNASIMVEKSSESKIRVDTHKGIFFHKGFAAVGFINNLDLYKVIYNDAKVLITDKKLQYDSDIETFLDKCYKDKIDRIVIIADVIEGQALNSLCITFKSKYNKGDGIYNVGVEAPEFGPTREEMLEDIAVMTGATVISEKNGIDFETADPNEVLGSCGRVVIDSKTTTMMDGGGDPEAIAKRIKATKEQINQLGVNEKITREKLEKRLQVMEAGVGILHAGGPTEIEAKERYYRMEDAILAVNSAVKSGYVAGGGSTYLQLAKLAKTTILQKALESVMWQVAENAGANPQSVVEQCKKNGKGWNAKTGKYADLLADGVIDATLVVEQAIKNAISAGSYFLTLSAAIVEDVVDNKDEEK